MRKIAAALLLSSFALSASAYELRQNTVSDPQACPAGTEASAHYKWQNGRFVRDGWVCEVVSPD